MRYRHKNTAAIYVSRRGDVISDEPEVRVGWASQGILDERASVYSTQGGDILRACWVSTLNLEQLDIETIDAAPGVSRVGGGRPPITGASAHKPDLEADARIASNKLRDSWALSLAETLTFNEGNAVLAIIDSDLDTAIGALVRERSRRYPAPEPTPEEAINE